MVKPLDSFLVCKIVTLREIGLSYNQIKEKLGLKSRSTAQSAYKRFLKTSSYSPKKPPGRPEKLSKKDKRLIIRSVKNDPKTTLQRIRVKYNSFATSKSVSRSTIRRVLKKYQIDENFQQKNRKFSKKISKFRNFPNFFIATPNGPSYKLFGTVRQFFLNTKGSPFEIFVGTVRQKNQKFRKKIEIFQFFLFHRAEKNSQGDPFLLFAKSSKNTGQPWGGTLNLWCQK